MSVIALELSDAGIMAASELGLIEVEPGSLESSGFALAEKKKLFIGKKAEQKARLYPRHSNNTFWDHLDTTSLKDSFSLVQNHAELAYAHLLQLWEHIQKYGTEFVISVPSFYTKEQLGLILGIAQELSMDTKGLVSLPIAASSHPFPDRLLLHLDIYLHRFEIVFLKQEDQLTEEDLISSQGKGLDFLYSQWTKAIADEFVRTTRFDPFHTAYSEQDLYNQLPRILAQIRANSTIMFEMSAGNRPYHVNLNKDMFIRKSESLVRHVQQLIEEMRNRYKQGAPLALQLTHRMASIPGMKESLIEMFNTEVIELEKGAGAFGALRLFNQISNLKARKGVSFLTSRAWTHVQKPQKMTVHQSEPLISKSLFPTHLLYQSIAYPLSQTPLFIGKGSAEQGIDVTVTGQLAGVSRKHCSIEVHNNEVILNDLSTYGTFVDDNKVSGTKVVHLGEVIRVGTPGEKLLLIACVDKK